MLTDILAERDCVTTVSLHSFAFRGALVCALLASRGRFRQDRRVRQESVLPVWDVHERRVLTMISRNVSVTDFIIALGSSRCVQNGSKEPLFLF